MNFFTNMFARVAEKSSTYEFAFKPDTWQTSLAVMVEGMLGIFIAIGVIMLVIALFGFFGKKKK